MRSVGFNDTLRRGASDQYPESFAQRSRCQAASPKVVSAARARFM